jgi:hypothetical protein
MILILRPPLSVSYTSCTVTISLFFQHFGNFREKDELEKSRGRTEKLGREIAVVRRDLIS